MFSLHSPALAASLSSSARGMWPLTSRQSECARISAMPALLTSRQAYTTPSGTPVTGA